MPHFSKESKQKLETCHISLQNLFNEVIKYFDCTIVYGHRTPTEQFELYKIGRKEINGIWVIENESEVITYKDGYDELSNHNYEPSLAVDAVPYPINWKDIKRMYYFGGFVKGIAAEMEIKIRHGADWNMDTQINDQTFNDLPHFEVRL